jgi:hypothetical protein
MRGPKLTYYGCVADRCLLLIKDGKIVRVSFSESLLSFLGRKLGGAWRVQQATFTAGPRLEPGEVSRSGLYGINTVRGDKTLRISLDRETAELLAADPSRYVVAVTLVALGKVLDGSEEGQVAA